MAPTCRDLRWVLGAAVLCVFGTVVPACGGAASAHDAAPKPLSPSVLANLPVSPPAPFVRVPDSQLKTGLMEVGNPRAGQLGIGWAAPKEIVAAGFQRGWESAYRLPNGAGAFDVDVFEFPSSRGPEKLVDEFKTKKPPAYMQYTTAGSMAFSGTSPEGRATVAVALARGRFLVSMVLGGPPGQYDYRALLDTLARQQLAKLPGPAT